MRSPDQCHHTQNSRDKTNQYGNLKGMLLQFKAVGFGEPDDQGRNPKSEKRTSGIASAMNTEGEATLLLVNAIRHQGIARGGADALSEPIRKPDAEHPLPSSRNKKKGLGKGGKRIARNRQPFALTEFIRKRTGINLHQTGRRFSDAVN